MANKSKEKGDRAERQLVDRFEFAGIQAERTGLSAQSGRTVVGDVIAHLPQKDLMFECKSRRFNNGWREILKWLQGVDAVSLKVEDSVYPLVVLPWKLFEELVLTGKADEPTQQPSTEQVDILDRGETESE